MAQRYWIGGTGNFSDTAHWSSSSGGSGGASVPGSADDAEFNASSGTGTVTIDVDVTVGDFHINGASTSLIFELGSAYILCSDEFYQSGGTVNPGTSTVEVRGILYGSATADDLTNVILTGGSLEHVDGWGCDSITLRNSGVNEVNLTGSYTFGALTINPETTVFFRSGKTITVSGNIVATGTPGKTVVLKSNTPGSKWTISKSAGTVSLDYVSITDSRATGGATFEAGPIATNGGNNTGWTFNSGEYTGPKTYLYRVYRSGVYLGLLPNVVSEFSLAQEINSGASQLEIELGISPDRSTEDVEAILDEDGNEVLDENNEPILEESRPERLGAHDSGSLLANDNTVKVHEYSTENPNGLLKFNGWITSSEGVYGASDNIRLTCISKGVDMQDYLVEGSPFTADVSQTTDNQQFEIYRQDKAADFAAAGQSWLVGAGVTNLAAIDIEVQAVAACTIRVAVYDNEATFKSGGTALAETSREIESATAETFKFTLPTPLAVTENTTRYFRLNIVGEGSAYISFSNSNPYANGTMYSVNYGGGGGSNELSAVSGSDLHFKTYSSGGATTAVFTSEDPTNILKEAIDNYVAAGGSANYDASSTDLTGLSLSYTFNTNTVLEGVNKCLELAPSDWYWSVDPGSLILRFKQTSATADHTFILGKHIHSLRLKRTVDYVVNKIYFSGGDTGSGENLLTEYTNSTSISAHGRQRLKRLADGRVILSATADVLADNELDAGVEAYESTIVIPYSVYDISTISVGDTVGFSGFGSPVDNLILQIVRTVEYPDYMEIVVGKIPFRQTLATSQALSELKALQTLDNPSTPS